MRVCKLSAAFRGTGKLFTIVTVVLLALTVGGTKAASGDLSAQPRDSLAITGSSPSMLAQTHGATTAAPAAAYGTRPSMPRERAWLQRLHVTGYRSELFDK